MKKKIEKLIELLADKKECECGMFTTSCKNGCVEGMIILPIMIGDVLEKIKNGKDGYGDCGGLVLLWKPCGFKKSLQEIFDCGWGIGCEYCDNGKISILENYNNFHIEGCEPDIETHSCEECGGYEHLKDPAAQNLLEFLIQIFNIK